MIIAWRHGAPAALTRLIAKLLPEVNAADARLVGDADNRWEKGVHPAGLDVGGCFAYVLATARLSPSVFAGSDFPKTDVPT
jgi:ribonuclease VapC